MAKNRTTLLQRNHPSLLPLPLQPLPQTRHPQAIQRAPHRLLPVSHFLKEVYTIGMLLPSDFHATSMQIPRAILRLTAPSAAVPAAPSSLFSPPDHTVPRYFVPFVDDQGKGYGQGDCETLVGKWKESSEFDAMGSLRLEGNGVLVGDGEDWETLGGTKRLWCEEHKRFCEPAVWVRTSSV